MVAQVLDTMSWVREELGRLTGAIVHSRSSRVMALVFAVATMSLADLYLTLTFLHGPGMNEGNPLARYIISQNIPGLLVAWKMMLLAITVAILYATRKTRSGEMASWVCLGVMLWLTGQWVKYAEKAPIMTPMVGQIADVHVQGADFVRFEGPQAQ